MLTFFDYLPSQNGWKVRQLLHELQLPHEVEQVSIFEGAGHSPHYLAVNPWGAVPAIRLKDGRVLSESNAILWYLAQGSELLPTDIFLQAKVLQWLSFEADYVQTSIGSLRYWTLTGKLAARGPALIESKRATGLRALAVLDAQLATRPFIVGRCSIADISLHAYAARAEEAGIPLDDFPHFRAWADRVTARAAGMAPMFPYSIDPHASAELP